MFLVKKIVLFFFLSVSILNCGEVFRPNLESRSGLQQWGLHQLPLLGAPEPYSPIASVFEKNKVDTLFLEKGLTLSGLLGKQGFNSREVASIGKTLSQFVNLNSIREGMRFDFFKNTLGELNEIHIDLSEYQRVSLTSYFESWIPNLENKPISTRRVFYQGVVTNSLWNSAIEQGVPPGLISVFAEIFSWQIDFSREIRPSDSWRFEVLEKVIDGKVIGWEPLPRAQYYSNYQSRFLEAYYYTNDGSAWGDYFDRAGRSLRRSFLRSPIPFGRITSRFSKKRFHPIKKIYRPHNGIDYGAPRGTPVRAVSGGRVIVRGRGRGNGNWVSLQHKGGFLTNYLHLQRFAPGLGIGDSIDQGQVIGFVGQTGSATGPHLHFEMKKNGSYVDPLKVDLPESSPLEGVDQSKFLDWVEGHLWTAQDLKDLQEESF